VAAVFCALVASAGLLVAPASRAATTSSTSVTGAASRAFTPTTVAPSAAETQTTVTKTVTQSVAAGTPVLITDKTTPPAGYRLTADQALAIAAKSPVVKRELKKHPNLEPYEYTAGYPIWQVNWFSHSKPQKEKLQTDVDDSTGTVTQAWAGVQVAWTMARGYPGAFGRIVNAWYIWLPICLLFVAPFIPWRRKPTLLHLDLLVAVSFFSISLALFNHAQIGLSVPLIYPPMIYLFVRLLLLAFGKGRPREPLRTIVPIPWLLIGIVFLMAFRIALNVLDSNVIDVGYAGVIGADKLIHGSPLYGNWPLDNKYGDTYGPFNYFVYVPFRLIFGWSGTWDNLPAAHAASIAFDVATLIALFFVGRRLKSNNLWSLSSNTNDSLVALMVTLSILVVTSPPARGVAAALAGLTKFAPFVITPLLLRGTGERLRTRDVGWWVIGFVITLFLCFLPVLIKHDLGAFWRDSIKYQANRTAPFEIWGLWGHLNIERHLLEGVVVAFALFVCVFPKRRGPIEVAALAGATIIALQCVTEYWLYSYTMWYWPLALIGLFAYYPEPGEHLETAWQDLEDRRIPAASVRVQPAGWTPPAPPAV
jgi:hypothetical protein